MAAIAKYAKLHTKFNAKWYRRLFKIHRLIPSTEFDLKLIATISYGYKSNAYRDDVIMGVYYRIHKSKDLVGRLLNCINASESVSISFDDLGYIESFFEKIKENE